MHNSCKSGTVAKLLRDNKPVRDYDQLKIQQYSYDFTSINEVVYSYNTTSLSKCYHSGSSAIILLISRGSAAGLFLWVLIASLECYK